MNSESQDVQIYKFRFKSWESRKGLPYGVTQMNILLTTVELLDQLPKYGSRTILPKKSVNMADLSALTAKTGDEFAMFTKSSKRLVVRGNRNNTPITVDDAKKMAGEGYKWSGHTHPETGVNVLIASEGDYAILDAFGQEQSAIYNSLGRYNEFWR